MRRIWLKIGEVANQLGVDPKELRYWERIIPELNVRRSKGNLRYYHSNDLKQLIKVRDWLHSGYAVVDCRELLLSEQNSHNNNIYNAKKQEISEIDSHNNQLCAVKLTEIANRLRKLILQLSMPVKH